MQPTHIYGMTSIRLESLDAERCINSDLQKLADICCAHGLMFNASKSSAMFLGRKKLRGILKSTLIIKVNGSKIEFSGSCGDLGLLIDEHKVCSTACEQLATVLALKVETV